MRMPSKSPIKPTIQMDFEAMEKAGVKSRRILMPDGMWEDVYLESECIWKKVEPDAQ
jgi:hypothetical protein